MPHSSTPVGGRFGRVAALPFGFVERNAIIEAVARFRENAGPRFDCFFGGSFGGVATAIWLEERKSENEGVVRGTDRVVCSAEVKTGRGLPASEELGRLPTRGVSTAITAHFVKVKQTYRPHSPPRPQPPPRPEQSDGSWRDRLHSWGLSGRRTLLLVRLGTCDPRRQ